MVCADLEAAQSVIHQQQRMKHQVEEERAAKEAQHEQLLVGAYATIRKE